mmetsp:Transcript_14316/g.30773  ORF Transcript_14316/g.30773 Transcript_14316/m.30773 type:complete len:112 (+) Transcript_14316:71-406(+)
MQPSECQNLTVSDHATAADSCASCLQRRRKASESNVHHQMATCHRQHPGFGAKTFPVQANQPQSVFDKSELRRAGKENTNNPVHRRQLDFRKSRLILVSRRTSSDARARGN